MKIDRPIYIQKLVDSKDNGLIKVVTGLRRDDYGIVMMGVYEFLSDPSLLDA